MRVLGLFLCPDVFHSPFVPNPCRHFFMAFSYDDILQAAFRIVARRRVTVSEMREKLLKKFPGSDEIISQVVMRLEELRYLDDRAFIEAYIHDRVLFRPRGLPIMKMELLKRGLKRSFIDEVVSGISVDQRELAQRLSESYQRRSSYRRSKNPQASLMRHLVSKGISFDVAREMTKRRVDFS